MIKVKTVVKCPTCEQYFSKEACEYAPKGYYERIMRRIKKAKEKKIE